MVFDFSVPLSGSRYVTRASKVFSPLGARLLQVQFVFSGSAADLTQLREELTRVVAQFRSGHGPIPVLFECYRIRTDSGMPRLDIRFSTSHLMMASTR